MRVSIVINTQAGQVNESVIRSQIETALFRCDLHFLVPQSFSEMGAFLRSEIEKKTNSLVFCGGDGTINACLQEIMPLNEEGISIPPVALICSGTANDLAHEVGISQKIEKAARAVLEGEIKKIDIIEVIASAKKAYMVTNGGLGIPALTAELSNQFRANVRDWIQQRENQSTHRGWVAGTLQKSLARVGPRIYPAMLIEAMREWDSESWSLQIDTGRQKIVTQSPFILINNQPGIGQSFTPAPYTSNSDGTFNGLIVEADSLLKQLDAVWQVKKGRIDRLKGSFSFETSKVVIRSLTERKFTFFGDGEILHRNVSEIEIRCLYQIIPLLLTSS